MLLFVCCNVSEPSCNMWVLVGIAWCLADIKDGNIGLRRRISEEQKAVDCQSNELFAVNAASSSRFDLFQSDRLVIVGVFNAKSSRGLTPLGSETRTKSSSSSYEFPISHSFLFLYSTNIAASRSRLTHQCMNECSRTSPRWQDRRR